MAYQSTEHMKTLVQFLAFIVPLTCIGQTSLSHLSSQQIWKRVVQHYDPDDRWGQFHGEMHMYTIRPTGSSSEEDLILDNAQSFYQSTLFTNDQIVEKRLEKGSAFFSINGRTVLTEEEKTQYQLEVEKLRQIHQHHQMHFGLAMHLQKAGLAVDPEVEKEIFNDIECWVLTFRGEAGKNIHPYFEAPIKLYVNPEDYSLAGMKYDDRSGGMPASYVIFNDEIEVGGIRLPKIKTYYLTEDDSY